MVATRITGLLAAWLFCCAIAGALFADAGPRQQVEVRLEPFPPLVRDDGSGLVVDALREAAHRAGLTLHLEIVSYSRAKYQLSNGQADLIGLIPLGRETDDFYAYAREIDWQVDTRADLFSVSPALLADGRWKEEPIGTPWGNADFFAGLTGVPRDQFVESSLANLVEMMTHGRLPVLLFERVATRTLIDELDGGVVYYRKLFSIPAGFAVQDNSEGARLAGLMEQFLPAPDTAPRFRRWRHFLDLPDAGRFEAGDRACSGSRLSHNEREPKAGGC